MITSKATTLWNDAFAPRRILSGWHWRYVLIGGDTFFLLCALSHTFFSSSIIDPSGRCNWLAWPLWMAVGFLSWIEGTCVVKPYAQRYAFCYRQGVLAIYSAIGVMSCCWSTFFLAFCREDYMRYIHVVIPFILMLGLLISFWRVLYYCALKLFKIRPQVIVIGHSSVTDAVIHDICHLGQPSPIILGYISSDMPANLLGISWPYLGEQNVLQNLIRHKFVDMIVVSNDDTLELGMSQEVFRAMTCGIEVLSLSDVYEHTSGRVSLLYADNAHSNMLVWGRHMPFAYLGWRWILDVGFCMCGGCVFVLLLPLLALLICLDSPGPIFYRQERVGYQGRSFRLLKFRSMHTEAERNGATWSKYMDARVTRVGRVLRAAHLDELPQVINILRGEMSLIGPRPERQLFVSQLEQLLPLFSYRLNVKPGLTGWAQVKMPYASTYQEAIIKLQYDLYYIKQRSFLLDITILLKTFVEVLWCAGR